MTLTVVKQKSGMQHTRPIITLLVVVIILSGSLSLDHKESLEFSMKICDIAKKRNAQTNILYTNDWKEGRSENSTHNIDWLVLYQCLLELPFLLRSLDYFPIEPARAFSSLNIFSITSAERASNVLDFIDAHQRWKQGHRYLFIWLLPKWEVGAVKDFFRHLWLKNILHALVIWDSVHVYTFEPFSVEGFRLKSIAEHQCYYYDKLTNFHHYEFSITMFTDPVRAIPLPNTSSQGYRRIDGRVASALVEQLNATARYIAPADNETYGSLRNGTFSGALGDIQSGLAHIGFNLRYTLDHVKEHVEELYPYQRRFLYLIVPAAEMCPEYMIFVRAFSNCLWRLIILNFCLVLVIFIIFHYLAGHLYQQENAPHSPGTHWQCYRLFEILYKTQLGGPVETYSSMSSLRQILMAWILFSYVLSTMYFAKLESNFVQPSYEPEMDSLDQLPQLNVPIYAFDIVFEAVKVSLLPQYYEWISAMGVRVPANRQGDKFAFEVTQKNARVGLILHDEMAKELLVHTFNEATKRPSYHIVREYLRTLTTSYVVTKGSPFIHKFQQVVSAFHEFGFIRHWLQVEPRNAASHNSQEFLEDLEDDLDMSDDEEGTGTAAPSEDASMKKVVLNLDILQGAFYLWLAGILISCVGFAAEWVYWWNHYQSQQCTSHEP
ncbi:uncharacterized protein LOC106081515 [Stomoxys calcitrans]|uniref:uncharacterized protein LOC106081515 n=1 Tax=Stomoxys calcitrans TaxID=35570 RepID=UPI0027E29DBE|nr:uncharacterized protein LOC106081515 [Stomoxys calcitrans]